jgi:hypothetical protein
MAKAFSAKQYFKKIYAPDLIVELYKRHNIVALFEITEQTPRKNAVGIFTDFYSSLSPEEKILVDEDLALVASVSTQYAPSLCINLLKKKGIPHEVTQIECTSDHDKTMYYYLFHKDIFDEMFFFHDFYTSKGYMRYEAKKVDLEAASFATTELTKEFTRIVNKDENQTECSVNHNVLENILYVTAQFSSGKEIVTEQDKETLTMRPVTKRKRRRFTSPIFQKTRKCSLNTLEETMRNLYSSIHFYALYVKVATKQKKNPIPLHHFLVMILI